jgi:peptidoglycan/xylan/chitin deacetylase (PgdA/CDA1 family)
MLIFAAIIFQTVNLSLKREQIKICFADDKETIKSVYLTFDDGPSDKVTPKILDILNEENVKATFFIIGKSAETRKYLVEREYNSGHTVAVHSYTHEYSKIYSSPQNLLNDINACNKLIYEITGEYSNVYRFPGGSFGLSSELISAVCEKGMRYVDWNASTRDAEIWNATPDQIVNAAISTSSDFNNVVLLAHDSTTKATTAQALRRIIRYYKDNGYVFERF